MRIKHIVLPIVAFALFGAYAVHSKAQRAHFSSGLWKAAHYEDAHQSRAGMLSPLMLHVLKVGMPVERIDALLGVPNVERSFGDYHCLGCSQFSLEYRIEDKEAGPMSLVLEFSHKKKLLDYYIADSERPLFF